MKGIIGKTAGVVLALGILCSTAACSGGSSQTAASGPAAGSASAGGDGEIKLALWDQSVGETDPTAKILPEVVSQWNKDHPNIQVERTGTTGEQYKTKIKTALAANEAPDVFYGMGGGSFMQPYIQAGNVLVLDQYVSDETKSKMRSGMLSGCQVNGKIYTLPCYTHLANLYVNTALFKKAGAKVPTTFDELLEAVTKLKAANITPAVIGEKDRWPGMYWFDIMAMRQAGNDACIAAFKDPAKFNSPDFIEAANKMQKLAKAGMFNSSMFSMSYDEMLAAFNAGNAAMLFQANWVNAGIEDDSSKTKGNVEVVIFPVFTDGKGKASEFYGGGQDGFYINSSTKNLKEAAEFLTYLSEELGSKGYLAGAGLPCWNTDSLDTSKLSTLDKTDAKLLDTGTSFITWWDNILPAESAEIHKNLIAELLASKITPEDFCKQMAQLKATELTF
ncbi:extracellular solute-binding protein [Caproicibacter fermentans]|uniref:Extracellular solute-binding protein n=1 Tax=Caproicibacter fermentans TaxID=2576756 RepID=A0A7G8T818_9FIRM|nr:extracellular solute-binding protein [Caproicibacter fermentans]QNK39759.1 extracellular solute-binding protein [Caproicibacter fermentans]